MKYGYNEQSFIPAAAAAGEASALEMSHSAVDLPVRMTEFHSADSSRRTSSQLFSC